MPDLPADPPEPLHAVPPIPDSLTREVARPTLPGARDPRLAEPASADDQQAQGQRSRLLAVSGLGMEFISTIGGGALIGYLLDLVLTTQPWCLLSFVVAGLFIATIRLVTTALRLSR